MTFLTPQEATARRALNEGEIGKIRQNFRNKIAVGYHSPVDALDLLTPSETKLLVKALLDAVQLAWAKERAPDATAGWRVQTAGVAAPTILDTSRLLESRDKTGVSSGLRSALARARVFALHNGE